MNTPHVLTQGMAILALALLMAACEDGPTLPDGGGEIEAQAAAALQQGAVQAQTLVEESLARLPEGQLPAGRVQTESSDPLRQRPDGTRGRPDHARRTELAVALGAESVALAERLLEGTDPTEEQLRHLQHACESLRRAQEALEAGRHAAAIELAHAAQIGALKAVVLPRGVSEEEARMIHELAAELLEEARSAVASDPSEVKEHLLALAERLFERGSEQLSNGHPRGVAALWKAAALASFLIG